MRLLMRMPRLRVKKGARFRPGLDLVSFLVFIFLFFFSDGGDAANIFFLLFASLSSNDSGRI